MQRTSATPFTDPDGTVRVDLQGIPWHLTPDHTRAEYRTQRNEQYSRICRLNDPSGYHLPIFQNLLKPRQLSLYDAAPLYTATHMSRSFACSVQHFQLRHLVSSPTSSSVFYTCKSASGPQIVFQNQLVRCSLILSKTFRASNLSDPPSNSPLKSYDWIAHTHSHANAKPSYVIENFLLQHVYLTEY
jgi:hypothetical protein